MVSLALIPSGTHAGQILFWTRCDNPSQNPAFQAYFLTPDPPQITGGATFPAGAEDSFCSGHTWVLDAEGKAKLFVAGGQLTEGAYWFDAESASWSADPVDLSVTNYYPSIRIEPQLAGAWVTGFLPTGEILAVGGLFKPGVPLATAELFDPKGPTQAGVWRSMHSRLAPSGQAGPIPRGYHSVALLTPSGEVVLMGGAQAPLAPNSMHTLEVYRPPYLYYSGRPSLTNVPATIHYPNGSNPNTFCVQTNAVWTSKATLIGVGSVTHHFDYGQRYVELMVRGAQCGSGNLEILPPVKSTRAPPGYYMLFLIDGFGLPSVGRLVKLDYQRP